LLDKIVDFTAVQAGKELAKLEKQMQQHAKNLEFEEAAALRDRIQVLRQKLLINPAA